MSQVNTSHHTSLLLTNLKRPCDTCCQVCDVVCDSNRKLRSGVVACGACTRFFYRCVKSRPFCGALCQSKGTITASSKLSFKPGSYRKMCRSCRYDKCLAVGFRLSEGEPMDTSSQRDIPRKRAFEPDSVISEMDLFEDSLEHLSKSVQTLQHGMFALPNLSQTLNQDSEGYRHFLGQLNDYTLQLSKFLGFIPYFYELRASDQCILLSNSFGKITTTISARRIEKVDASKTITLSAQDARLLASLMPILNLRGKHVSFLSLLFKQWQPSYINVTFEVGFLLFDEQLRNQMENVEVFDTALATLRIMYAAVQQSYQNRDSLADDEDEDDL